MSTFSRTIKQRLKAADRLKKKPEGPFVQLSKSEMNTAPKGCTRVYKNSRYCVMVYDDRKTDKGPAINVLVQRWDDTPIPNHWREMQRIKNEIFGKETMAIEYYPKESELIDMHNIYWMWIFPEGVLPKPIL